MKYLGVKTDGKLNWKDQNYDAGTKLDRVIALLCKIRIFVNFNPLKAIFFAIFVSHVNYANLIKGQKPNPKLWINTLQKKALITINNQPRNSHSGPLFKKSNTLKFEDKILISKIYIIFISKSINNLLPLIFKNWFIFCSKIHNYDTVSLPTDKMFKPSYRTDSYGFLCSGFYSCRNKTQNMFGGQWLESLHPTKIKNILTQRCINKYQ